MRIVVVGGSSTNVGKTTLACQLLQSVPSDEAWAAMKVSVHGRECPTRVAVCSGRDDDERHTDTQRLLDAGARFVVWVTVWRPHVRQGLAAGLRALRRLPVQGVVIESTSAGIELRRIAASWFVAGTQPWKPWAWRHLVRADAVVTAHGHGSWAVPTAGLLPSHAPEADVNLLPSALCCEVPAGSNGRARPKTDHERRHACDAGRTGDERSRTMHQRPDDVSREDFLKTVGALSLVGAGIVPATQVVAAASVSPGPETITSASHFGIFQATVANGAIAHFAPHPSDPHAPEMLLGLADLVYSPSRVKYPMVRRGFLKNGHLSDTAERGNGDFVRVSWDEALSLVASEIKRIKKTYGNSALYAGSYGWQSAGQMHNAFTLLHRFYNGVGGYVGDIGDYSTAAAQRILPHAVGSLAVYEQQTAWPVVLKNTKLIVLWGADLIQNNKIDWVVPDHYVYAVLPKLKASGIRVVSINPFRTDADVYLNAEHIAIRPCTDVAVMLAMAHVLYTEKLHDQTFLDTYTVGFDKFRAYLLGTTDGQPKTPAWAERISGVPAHIIAQLARDMAHHRTMIMAGWALQRQDHGEQPHWMLVTLASMLGQIGLPGGGFGFSYHYCSGGSPTSSGPALPGISVELGKGAANTSTSWLDSSSRSIPVTRFVDMLLNPGKTIDFDGQKITFPDIKLIHWAGGNPFAHHQDQNRMIQAWRRPETIIVQEISWTATARYADIVLPVTTTLERNDIASIGSYSNKGFVAMKKVVEPLYEARSDYAIFSDLAQRLGFARAFTEGRDEMAWITYFYESARKAAAATKLTLPDFATFWKKGLIEFPIPESAKSYVTYADFRADPEGNPLSTPSGRIEIYSTAIAKFGYDDCPPHPTWLEPIEWLGSKKSAIYPLALSSPHPKFRLHSQLDNTKMEQATNKPGGRAPAWMHPNDAKVRGLASGDTIRVFNGRGQVLATVMVTDRIMPGVVRMEEGVWYDALKGGVVGTLDVEGNPNTLTMDKGTSKLAQGEIVNSTLVQVAKYIGPVPPVRVYTPPAGG